MKVANAGGECRVKEPLCGDYVSAICCIIGFATFYIMKWAKNFVISTFNAIKARGRSKVQLIKERAEWV